MNIKLQENKVKPLSLFLLFLVLIIVLITLSLLTFNYENKNNVEITSTIQNTILSDNLEESILVNGYELDIDFSNLSNNTWIDVEQMSTLIPNYITISNLNDYEVYINDILVDNNTTTEINLTTLSTSNSIKMEFVNIDTHKSSSIKIRTLTSKYNAYAQRNWNWRWLLLFYSRKCDLQNGYIW